MIARSPTYIFPMSYVNDAHVLGVYEKMPLHAADELLMTFPVSVDGQMSHGLFSHLASLEPYVYGTMTKPLTV
jgi:hypothetical protein